MVSYLDHPASAVFQAWDTDQALLSQEPEIPKPFTLINFQGKLDCKYKASYHFSPHPRGKNDERGWPASAEENMERLEDAGFVHDRLVPYCSKCDGSEPTFNLTVVQSLMSDLQSSGILPNSAPRRKSWTVSRSNA